MAAIGSIPVAHYFLTDISMKRIEVIELWFVHILF